MILYVLYTYPSVMSRTQVINWPSEPQGEGREKFGRRLYDQNLWGVSYQQLPLNSIWWFDLWACLKSKRMKGRVISWKVRRRGEDSGGRQNMSESRLPAPLFSSRLSSFPALLFILPHPSLRGCYPTPSWSLPSVQPATDTCFLCEGV